MEDKFVYRKAVSELYYLVNKEKLREITATNSSVMGLVSAVSVLIRSAVEKSSLCVKDRVVHCFTGMIYEPFRDDSDFKNMVFELWEKLGLPLATFNARRRMICDTLRDMTYSKYLIPDITKVVFENGVFDIDKKEFHKEVDKTTVCLSILPYSFSSRSICPRWQMFLDSILPDKKYQMMLQEFLGGIFIDRTITKIETMLILKGDGANGKSVIHETVLGVLGKDNVSNLSFSDLLNVNEARHNVLFMQGKRLNYSSEINATNSPKESDTLKSIISGEPMSARANYGNTFTVYKLPLMMANCNKLPYYKNWSYGLRRRFSVIPFDVTIPYEKVNPNLAHELSEEYAGIFNWIIEGRDRFRLQGCKFTESEELSKILNDEAQAGMACENTILLFMYDAKSKSKNFGAMFSTKTADTEGKAKNFTLTTLYLSYCMWCKNRRMKAEKRTVFKNMLVDLGYQYVRCSSGNCFKIYVAKNDKANFQL